MTYDLTCLFTGNLFDTYNCLVVNSSYVLLYVTLLAVFGITAGVFSRQLTEPKNLLLLASVMTLLTSIVLLFAAGASGYAADVITRYSSAALFCAAIAFAALMYNILDGSG